MADVPADELRAALTLPDYPRSARWDPRWMLENVMGPNPIWLAESIAPALALAPGMDVLDLGCGRAVSSIFLAAEFGVRVCAADLWVDAAENLARIRAAGHERDVVPVHAEAHALPFPERHFDAIVSLDAYHYFGTDDLYVGYLSRFLRPGGRLGVVSPGLTREITEPPAALRPFWEWEFCSFHSAEWWRTHWAKTGQLEVETADMIPDGWRHWLAWSEVCARADVGLPGAAVREAAMLREDAGRLLGFVRVVGRRAEVA
jgi:cyclopropane fatty-acyl-phospholipid synthase-like methyltransferase